MKIDLDPLMRQNEIDAILVTGPAQHNPAMTYLTGGGHITQADLIQKAGEPAVLFHGMMERDEAARTGLQTRSYSLYPMGELLQEAGGDAFGWRCSARWSWAKGIPPSRPCSSACRI
jgi:Xaa-Pro aminopeptidase